MSGNLLAGEIDEVTVSVDITGLSAGEYSCELTISDPDASNSPQVLELSLRILEEGLWVPYVYPTIQEAIDAAGDGDTVIVDVGTYVENINFGGKNITLTSTNPDDWSVVETTIINGGGLSSVVTFEGSDTYTPFFAKIPLPGTCMSVVPAVFSSTSSKTVPDAAEALS